MTAPDAVLSAEALAAYDAGYRLGKAAGLAEGALRRETPDGAPNDTLDALTAHAQRTGEYDPAPLGLNAIEAQWCQPNLVSPACVLRANAWDEGRHERATNQPPGVQAQRVARCEGYIASIERDVQWLVRRVRELEAERAEMRLREATTDAAYAGLRRAMRVERDRLTARVAELEADADRLDWLERETMLEPLVLHDGRQEHIGGLRGLGLMPGSLRRTLREAIDAARTSATPEPTEGDDA